MTYKFNEADQKQLEAKDITIDKAKEQIGLFVKGIPFINLLAPATIGNGIRKYDAHDVEEMIRFYDTHAAQYPILKFVPASGAASRMFKDIFALREDILYYGPDDEKTRNKAGHFLAKIRQYPFYKKLRDVITQNNDTVERLIEVQDVITLTGKILFEHGLNYAQTPKALIDFHDYGETQRTAIEEHLAEGALYACSEGNNVNLHFTISPEHEERITALIKKVRHIYEERYGVVYNISYSIQKPSTDTIAVDSHNEPFRDTDGSLLFRPGGHGALIENLNECAEPLIFIKNIDNIVPDRLKDDTVAWKKLIAAALLKIKDAVKACLIKLESQSLSIESLQEMATYAKDAFDIQIPADITDKKTLQTMLFEKLNRPIRVCGMVKNEGEPGGGPFWVYDPLSHEESLQIIESSQIDMNNPAQKSCVDNATHFNPVDLVCWTRDFKDRKFNLKDFVNPDTAFISSKSKDGSELKALELPGLWNGAMAYWITVFVEVPLITFNPVKTIDDLLREEHKAVTFSE